MKFSTAVGNADFHLGTNERRGGASWPCSGFCARAWCHSGSRNVVFFLSGIPPDSPHIPERHHAIGLRTRDISEIGKKNIFRYKCEVKYCTSLISSRRYYGIKCFSIVNICRPVYRKSYHYLIFACFSIYINNPDYHQ